MTPSRALLSSPVLAATVTAILLGTGCNFILNPEKSDEVIRCKNTTECEEEPFFFAALNTERFDASCGAPSGGGGGGGDWAGGAVVGGGACWGESRWRAVGVRGGGRGATGLCTA